MNNLTFAAPENITDFFDMMAYFNNLTDIGQGSMFWTVILIVASAMLFMMMKAYSVEKASSITFIFSFFLALLLNIIGWVNSYVVTITVILAVFGIYLLVKESSQYE